VEILRTGALLEATKIMAGYRYDPRLRIPLDIVDFYRIEPPSGAIYLFGIPDQITAVAELGQWGNGALADLHALLIGDKIIWQAWYHDRKGKDGEFTDNWKIVIP
jgi:hypothetical protein